MQQVLVEAIATLSVTWYDANGDIDDPGTVTVTLTRADGTALEMDAATVGTGAAARTFALTATHTGLVDILTALWESDTLGDRTTTVEVVGDLLFTEAEARAFDGGRLSDTDTYSDDEIAKARIAITEDFAQILGVSPYPRYKRIVLDGKGTASLWLPDHVPGKAIRPAEITLRSVEYRDSGGSTWTAYTSTELADMWVDSTGEVFRETLGTFPKGRRNVRISYEYGHPEVPRPIQRAALWVLVGGDGLSAVSSNIDSRAMSYSDGVGTLRFLTPGIGKNSWYSDGNVNRILRDYAERVPAVG